MVHSPAQWPGLRPECYLLPARWRSITKLGRWAGEERRLLGVDSEARRAASQAVCWRVTSPVSNGYGVVETLVAGIGSRPRSPSPSSHPHARSRSHGTRAAHTIGPPRSAARLDVNECMCGQRSPPEVHHLMHKGGAGYAMRFRQARVLFFSFTICGCRIGGLAPVQALAPMRVCSGIPGRWQGDRQGAAAGPCQAKVGVS